MIIGIDEHSIHKGRKFVTSIVDIGNHRVYDIIKGSSANKIESLLMRYKERDNVKVVCMDLSSPYRAMVRRCFPNTKILVDRFHVIKIINHHFMEFPKKVAEQIKWKRPFLYALQKKSIEK